MAKILYADDSATARSMAKSILTDAGYEVLTVASAGEARSELTEYAPELVMLDVYMGGTASGLELAQDLRARIETESATVVLVIGKMEPQEAGLLEAVKPDAIVTKPFEASELISSIKRGIQLSSTRRKPLFDALNRDVETVPQFWPTSVVASVFDKQRGAAVKTRAVAAPAPDGARDEVAAAVARVIARMMPSIVAEVKRELGG